MDYTIIQIEEEQIPLTATMGNNFFGMAMIILLILFVAFMLIMYLSCCRRYQSRIRQLDNTGLAYGGYRIAELKKTITELEMVKLAELEKP